ncbi:MAG: hypothetical protein ACRDOE_26590, partial [Streptosporangiaceae bacterium]
MTVAYLGVARRKAQAQPAVLAIMPGCGRRRMSGPASGPPPSPGAPRPAGGAAVRVPRRGGAAARRGRERGLYRAGERRPRTELLVRALVSG